MSLRNEPAVLPIAGKKVAMAHSGEDQYGYGYVHIAFDDGSCLVIVEHSQSGAIVVTFLKSPEMEE